MASHSPTGSPYLQLEFTAEDDMTMASDAEAEAEDDAERPSGNRRADSADPGPATPRARPGAAARGRRRAAADDARRRTAAQISTRAFFAALLLLVFVTGFACRGYLYGILRILAEEVDLSGAEAVTIMLSYDVGFVVVLCVVALQNRKVHRPRSVGFGGFLIGVGLLVACVPYFIVRSDLSAGQWYLSTYELCDETVRPTSGNQTDAGGRTSHADPPLTHWNSVAWIVLGLVLAGIGAVPQFPLGITYLEDRLRGFGTPFYVAILLCAYLLGIWCGELANMFMWQHVATANATTVTLWWLGFFASALVALVLGLFTFMARDPYKRLVKETNGASSAAMMAGRAPAPAPNGRGYRRLEQDDEGRPKAGKVPARWRRILTNVQLVCLALAGSCEVALLTGFLVFLPRYVGTISDMGRGPAKFYIATTIISSACIGILTSSGLTLHRKFKARGLSRMAVIGCAVALFFMLPLYIFRCESPGIVGNWTGDGAPNGIDRDFPGQITAPRCPVDCGCSRLPYRPVCGSDGRTYLSPCLAGCHDQQISDVVDSQGLKRTNFTDCSCVMTSNNATGDPAYALSGPCASQCSNEWPFVFLVFVAFFMTGVQFGPTILLCLRCVIRADRIAALSFHVSAWHILGYIPALIYFSGILNQSCALWGRPDRQNYHECALYDSFEHNALFVSVALALKAASLVLNLVAYRYTGRAGTCVNTEWAEYDTVEMEPVERDTNSRQAFL